MTAAPAIELLHHARDRVGESPLWDSERGTLWWVDVGGSKVRAKRLADGAYRSFDMPAIAATLALADDGSLIVAAGLGWYRLDEWTGALEEIASLTGRPGTRFNDGVSDTRGRFWIGTMDMSPQRPATGELCVLEHGRARRVLGGLRTQNGCAISPDGTTFYLADSHPEVNTVWAFDFDPETGALANRRVFRRPSRGRVDGAAIDAEGCYWFAGIDAGRLARLDPDGREMMSIDLPVSRPTKPAFGGADLSTIYLTTMSAGTEAAREPLAGAVLAIDVGVRGHPQPRVATVPARRSAAAGAFQHG